MQEIQIRDKTLRLPEAIQVESDNRYHTYTVVDYRSPVTGEYFVTGIYPKAFRAQRDMTREYPIIDLQA